jgi:Ni,Fe-hydrogenase maturation factor
MYGLHLIEETEKLKTKNIVTKNYEHWDSQLEWLKIITVNFKKTVETLKIDLGKTNMVKYIDTFLFKVEKEIRKAKDHIKKILNKKGFTKQELIYI